MNQDTGLTGFHGDTNLLADSSGIQGASTGWLTALLIVVILGALLYGVKLWNRWQKAKQEKIAAGRHAPNAPSIAPDSIDLPPPQNGPLQPYESTEEKRRKARGKKP